jgi:hypothetical protein
MRIPRTLAAVVLMIAVSWAADDWVVRADGVGPAKVGMSPAQLSVAVHQRFAMPTGKGDRSCFYVNPKSHPQIAFMIEDGKLVRVDVDKRGISTMEGVQLGNTQARAQRVYGARLTVEPSKYTGDEGAVI